MLRQTVRSLLRHPAYSAVAVLTLAIGIGANTAIFSIVDGVLLKPLAYREPGRLMVVREHFPPIAHLYPKLPANLLHYFEWRKEAHSLEGVAAWVSRTVNLTAPGEPEQLPAAFVSFNFFSVLGVPPRIGRSFTVEEEANGKHFSVILTDGLWRRRFNADPSILGRPVTLNGQSFTIVGVLPPEFRYPQFAQLSNKSMQPPELFRPLGVDPSQMGWLGDYDYSVIARLKPGVTENQALAELNVLEARIMQRQNRDPNVTAILDPLEDQVVGAARKGLLMLQAAVGAVLLIVCLNLANLTIVHLLARSRDFAVRAAIGASARQLVGTVLAETLLLGTAGGVLGCALAYGAIGILRSLVAGVPRLDEVTLDWRVMLFAALVSIACAVAVGLMPAWRLARGGLLEILQAASARLTEGRGSLRLRELLVASETALSVVLLVTAGLLGGSLLKLLSVNKGFQSEHALSIELALPAVKYQKTEQSVQFCDRLLAAAEKVPGVASVGLTSFLPLAGETRVNGILLEGQLRDDPLRSTANFRSVSPGLFRALGMELKQGRFLDEHDRPRAAAVISESTARKVWPNENPIGKKFWEGNNSRPQAEVVGVIGDVKTTALDKDASLTVYLPHWYRGEQRLALVVRTTADPGSLINALREEVRRIDPELPFGAIRTLDQLVGESVAQRRFQVMLTIGFALVALLLASLGIYGVLSYSVAQRTNEIGIRMALGAKPGDLLAMILKQGLRPVLAGLAIGLAAALAAGRIIQSLLYGVTAGEPWVFALGCGMLLAAGLVACLLPATRAARLEPMAALRRE